jgi:uncharacterized membrane protein
MSAQRVTMVIAILLVGLSAGFFFSYAASVTLGLAQVDDITYVRTFQAINDTVTNAWFGVVFFGSVFALGAAVAANWSAGRSMRALTGIALALYLTGVAITGIGNVPLNDELATVTVPTTQSAEVAHQGVRSGMESAQPRTNPLDRRELCRPCGGCHRASACNSFRALVAKTSKSGQIVRSAMAMMLNCPAYDNPPTPKDTLAIRGNTGNASNSCAPAR